MTKEREFSVTLTPKQIMILDGSGNEKAQDIIDKLKHMELIRQTHKELTDDQAFMVATIVSLARNQGKIGASTYRYLRGSRTCPCCCKDAGFAVRKRATKYHRKGTIDYSNPLSIMTFDLSASSVAVTNYVSIGYCKECKPIVEPIIIELIKDLPVETELLNNNWKKVAIWHCKTCGWKGPETDMGKLPAIFGGTYAGECPKCHARNLPFGPHPVETTGKHTMLEIDSESKR